jgi:hypothetical protein
MKRFTFSWSLLVSVMVRGAAGMGMVKMLVWGSPSS